MGGENAVGAALHDGPSRRLWCGSVRGGAEQVDGDPELRGGARHAPVQRDHRSTEPAGHRKVQGIGGAQRQLESAYVGVGEAGVGGLKVDG